MIGAIVLALLLDAPAPKASPRPRPTPTPVPFDLVEGSQTDPPVESTPLNPMEVVPSPPPVESVPLNPPRFTSVEKANRRGFTVDAQLGALGTVTGENGTEVSPTFWVNASGPIALGSEKSYGRLGARLGLTSSPGTTFNAADVKTYNAAEAGFWGGYVIGSFRDVETTILVEGDFASRIKGTNDPKPLNRLSRSAGIGLRFDARKSNANMAVLVGFDEATSSCTGNAICTGFHSGVAIMLYGQVPIVKGAILFTGDCSLSLGGSVDWLIRRDILRIGAVVDPVQMVKVIQGAK